MSAVQNATRSNCPNDKYSSSGWHLYLCQVCDWCQVEDTREHKFTQCCRYDDLRARHAALFQEWDQLPLTFRHYGLVPANPWQDLVWEAFASLQSGVTDFQCEPTGHRLHVFTDGTCTQPDPAEALSAWAFVLADYGVVASGPVPGPMQCILRAEIFAVISVLSWIRTYSGDVHLWIDNETVVAHIRDLQKGLSLSGYAHADLWLQVRALLALTPANLYVHKVASHVAALHCETPLEDFCQHWNQLADAQADVANQQRPRYFENVWKKYLDFREVWKNRVRALTSFQLAIAEIDCQPAASSDEIADDSEVSQLSVLVERIVNSAHLYVQISASLGQGISFADTHDADFRKLVSQIAHWLVSVDASSFEMRPVSIPELYLGYRHFANGGSYVSVGSDSVTLYQAVTFASDMNCFRKALRHLLTKSGLTFSPDKVDLSCVKIFVPQVAVQLGWPHDVEHHVLSLLAQFVGSRPITTSQGFAKPWTS